MKKTATVLWMVLMFMLALSGCTDVSTYDSDKDTSNIPENELYQVYVYDYSDAVPSAKHKIEYEFADRNKYDLLAPNTSVKFSVGDKNLTGYFQSSQYREFNYFPVNQYTNNDGLSFEIDDLGILTSCFWGNASISGEKKTKDECIEIAKKFLVNIVDINDYDINVEDNVERGLYTVNFTKRINGIKTTDSATIVVRNDGNLYSYSSFMLGRVSKDLVPADIIALDKVKASINNKLNQIYQEAKNNYSRIDYGEPDIMLTALKDGKVGFVCTVSVECINTFEEFEMSISERVNFVVILD